MFTKIMKWISISGLLLAVLWHPAENSMLLLQFVVCGSALLVAWGAYSSARHFWAIGFVAIAILFNPVQPWMPSRGMFLWLDLLSLTTFLASVILLSTKPIPSMPSLTNRMTDTRSL